MVRIEIFGSTTVHVGGHVVTGTQMGGVKPRQILELLALEAGTPVPKDRLVDLVWSGHPQYWT